MDVVVVGSGVSSARLREPGDVLRPAADAAEPFEPAAVLGRGVRFKDRCTRWALVAVTRALEHAGLAGTAATATAVVGSSNLGNLDTVCRTAATIATGTVADTSPMDLPNASPNVVTSSIAVRFGLRGPNVMLCNGTSSGLDAVHLAALLITSGRADRAVVVGAEPADAVVRELVPGETGELFDGAAAVVLESATAAAARSAPAHARIGRYARRAGVDGSVERVLRGNGIPHLWFAGSDVAAPPALSDVHRKDLEAAFGSASGALGVLQVVAATRWLADGGGGTVLATAGATDDGVASLAITTPGETP